MEEIPDKRPPASLLTDVRELELNRLSILNEQLVQAEQWIDRRSREMVAAYGLAAAQARHGERTDEDVELVATVLFLLREDHPDFLHGQHNVVTRIDMPILPATSCGENVRRDDVRTASPFPEFSVKWCSLFLNLYERALQGDTVKLLSIGTLCINVVLAQQQLRSW
ncbi:MULTISPECIES: hypothetical protein [Paraburkholderia]|uniref:hypothetical protein n=1 Tax=Paraburkholderia TaxID=1822464 RepID=UPI00285667A1|nr:MULTISPECIES: hypothetical protein [Paraburkholderia]MDR6383435.1 hypothetical protein [Paraburkholderia caribensis]MDR6388895.1 hypothetical protein [Paraburkholderia phenoliruptrix]MDR6419206.1 hypothetical protein [Paraburkholderia phenoliruptrix]